MINVNERVKFHFSILLAIVPIDHQSVQHTRIKDSKNERQVQKNI